MNDPQLQWFGTSWMNIKAFRVLSVLEEDKEWSRWYSGGGADPFSVTYKFQRIDLIKEQGEWQIIHNPSHIIEKVKCDDLPAS